MRGVLVFLFLLVSYFTHAQVTGAYSPGNILEEIKKMEVMGSVLYIAAHPDDENTQLLAYLSKEKKYRTAYLSVTRGEGGQNLIGDELGIELGLIRTQELLSARKIDGAQQFFTTAFDFGFSKNPQETFKHWDKEKILGDMVWVIRKFRPDIIITRFPTTGEGGHGHHTASAILAGEAFEAAADPKKYPEQFAQGVQPWTTKRLLWNTFNFGSVNTIKSDQFKLDVGGYNATLGKSYGELAAMSRSQHKSQGFGVPSSRGSRYEYFKLIAGTPFTSDLMDGVVTNWSRIGHAEIQKDIQSIINKFEINHPEKAVAALSKVYQQIQNLPSSFWRDIKLEEIKNLIGLCSGLYMEANAPSAYAVQGDSLQVNVVLNPRLPVTVSLLGISKGSNQWKLNQPLTTNQNFTQKLSLWIGNDEPISQPYWLQFPKTPGAYVVPNQQLVGIPWNRPEIVTVQLRVGKLELSYDLPINYHSNDPVKGEDYEPLQIIPPIEVRPNESLGLVLNQKPVELYATTTVHRTGITPDSIFWKGAKVLSTKNGLTLSGNATHTLITWNARSSSHTYDLYQTLIRYPHIPPILYFQKATTNLVSLDLKISGENIGYIAGAGDKVPDALLKMGYRVTMLTKDDLTTEKLKNFDAIITGVRAYNIHSWLNEAYSTLMNYVKEGGVLLVQYNTNNNIGPLKAQIGPYPFLITRERVTEEDAPVKFSDPQNIMLHYPNEITSKDFENWIQERSIYHAVDSMGNYQSLFDMNDTGEKDISESLIYTDFGKGRFIYTGIAFFRELPAGVPGAFRLLANLLAPPKGIKP